MSESGSEFSGYVSRDQVYMPTIKQELNSSEGNLERYYITTETTAYNAVITDLDGIVLKKDVVDKKVLDAMLSKTLSKDGKIPLSIATGRTLKEVNELVIPSIINNLLLNKIDALQGGDLTIFASNGALGLDVATGRILYEIPINRDVLSRAKGLDAMNTLLEVVQMQAALKDENGKKVVGRAKTIEDDYTYTFGLDPQKINLIEGTDEGERLADKFRNSFGNPEDLISVAQRLNKVFEENKVALVATTSGAMIDINAAGVSKGLAVRVTRQIVAKKFNLALSDIPASKVLSIGDSTLGNDEPLTQRDGGFSNKGPILPGSKFPMVIPGEDDQFAKVVKLFNGIKTEPAMAIPETSRPVSSDYLVEQYELFEGLPGKGIEYRFDKTGSILLNFDQANNVLQDQSLPESVRTFMASHLVVDVRSQDKDIMTRGKAYYEVVTANDESKVFEKLTALRDILSTWNLPIDRELTKTEQISMLTILDHSKALSLRLLNTELMYSQNQPNREFIKIYTDFSQNQVDNYYRVLLNVDRKQNDTTELPSPHQVSDDDDAFHEHVREMDMPELICLFSNYLSEQMRKQGKEYDYVVSPFYGAAELGFALRSILEIKNIQAPQVLPVRFSGSKAREYIRQDNIFSPDIPVVLPGSKLLILDDNSGTALTLRSLREELARYAPAVIDVSVVQAGVNRVNDVINGNKSNFARNILEPEDIQYKSAGVYDLNKRLELLALYIKYGTLQDYLNISNKEQ